MKDEEEESSLVEKADSVVHEKLEKVFDMKGRPYTAADYYAARLVDTSFFALQLYGFQAWLNCGLLCRCVQTAYREYREIRVQVIDPPLDGFNNH